MTKLSDLSFDFNQFLTDVEKGATAVEQTAQQADKFIKDPVAAGIKSLTFYTNFSPEKTYTGAQLSAKLKDKTPNPYLSFIKPTIILDTQLGKFEFAPYGKADVGFWKSNVVQVVLLTSSVLLLLGTGIFVWGRSVGRKGG